MSGAFLLLVAVQWEAGAGSPCPQFHKYTVLNREAGAGSPCPQFHKYTVLNRVV
jgi:hypothetical protein